MAGASWTTIGAAQDPSVSRQVVQQHYRRLVPRADVTSGGGTVVVVKLTPEPARDEETSVPTVNEGGEGPSPRSAQRQLEPSRTAVSAGGIWAADDRRDLIRACRVARSDPRFRSALRA